MNDYVILTDSSCDLSEKMIKKLDVSVLPLTLLINNEVYNNYLNESDINFTDFYDLLRQGQMAKTSAVNVKVFEEAMKKILEQGKDILFIGMSSSLSCTVQNAVIAAEKMSEIFIDRKIHIVDSLCASLGEGLLVYLASNMKKEGKSIDEVRDYIESTKLKVCHWFTVGDLHHLKRGGRLSATSTLIGSVLNIKPILHVDDEGRLVSFDKVRGRKASIENLANKTIENIDKGMSEVALFISHADCEDNAKLLANMISKSVNINKKVINFIGPVVGAHAGPNTLAVFFVGKKR